MKKPSLMLLLLTCALALQGCGTTSPTIKEPVVVDHARLGPPPPEVMVEQKPNFRERLEQIFMLKRTVPTTSSASSDSASK